MNKRPSNKCEDNNNDNDNDNNANDNGNDDNNIYSKTRKPLGVPPAMFRPWSMSS